MSGPPEPPPDAPPAGGHRTRRRRSRFRRWVVRPIVWAALLAVLVLTALLYFVESGYAHRRAAALVVARLSETLGREVSVGRVEYHLYPLAFELHDLVVPGARPGEPPFAVVPVLRVQGTWRGLRQRILHLEQIEVLRPRLLVAFFPDGTTNVPSLRGRGGGRRRFEVQVGRVLVQDGRLTVDQRQVRVSLDARAVWGRMVGEGEDRLRGLATAQEVTVALPDAAPYRVTASVKGSFEPGVIRVTTARFAGPDVTATAGGTYEWEGRRKTLALDLRAAGLARLANRLGYVEEPLDGRFSTRGRLTAVGPRWQYRGTLAAPRVEALGRRFEGIAAGLEVDPEDLVARVSRARHAGGGIEGIVRADLSADTEEGTGRPVDLDLDLDGLDLQTLLADQGLELAGIAGRVSGDFLYRFRTGDPLGGSGRADLTVVGAAGLGPEAPAGTAVLPVSGPVPLVIERGVVTTREARLTAPEQTLVAAGSYDLQARRGRFALRLASGDVGRLAVMVPVSGPRPAWLPTAGAGEATGTLTLAEESWSLAARVELERVASPALAVDSLAGSLVLDPAAVRDLRLTARSGDASLTASGTIPLPDEAGGGRRPFALLLDSTAWPIDALGELVPGMPPAAGTATGRVDLRGTVDDLAGEAELAVAGFAVAGHRLGRAHLDAVFSGAEVELRRAQVMAPAGELLASGRLDRETGAFTLTAEAPSLSLASDPLGSLLGGEAEGRVTARLAASGTLERPQARLSISGRDLVLAGRALPEGRETTFAAAWDGERLEAEGSVAGLLTLGGGGRLDRRGADLAFAVHTAELGTVARLLSPRELPAIGGALAGTLEVTGDFAREAGGAAALRARLTVPELTLTAEGRTLASLEPVVVSWTPQRLSIDRLYMAEPETESEVFLTGTVGLGAPPNPLDLRILSTVSAAWAELFLPGVEMEGGLDLLLVVRGTVEDPAWDGQGELRGAELILPAFPHAFEEVNGVLLFYRDAVVVDRLSARVGGGTVVASGRIALPGEAPQGAAPSSYRFQLSARNVSVRFPEGFLTRGDAELTLTGTAAARQVRGVVDLERAYYLQDVETGTLQLLQRMLQRERLEIAETDPFLASTQLNVQVLGPEALRVRNNVADFSGAIELAVRGTAASPVVVGEVELAPGGRLTYADNEYEIERGRLTFNNPARIDPVIDLVARTEVRSYDVVLSLSGTLDRLNARFSSDEGLADLEVLALLATGQELEGEGRLFVPGERRDEELGLARGLLYGQAASLVSRRVSSLFGFDRFRIDPLASSETGGGLGGVRLTVGKRISRDFFVTYTSNPSRSEEYVLRAEWQVARNLVLVFTREGRDDTFAVDAEWERRF